MIKGIKRRFNLYLINHMRELHHFKLKLWLINRIPGVHMGEGSKIVGKVVLSNVNLTTGKNCFLNRDVYFYGNGNVTIGDNVDIAPGVAFLTGGHLIGTSEHRAGEGIVGSIKISDGSWIGCRAMLMDKDGKGLTIGSGDVIAAGALVNKNTEPDCLYAGVPAVKKKELSKETIESKL